MKRLKFNFDFFNYEKLLKKITYSFHQTTGIEFDDLFQEAAYAYCEALKTYNPTRGKITTHVWWCVQNRLKDYIKENKTDCVSLENIKYNKSQDINYFIDQLTIEGFQIAKLILKSPKQFYIRSQEDAIQRIKAILQNNGWNDNKIELGINDLKTIFSN